MSSRRRELPSLDTRGGYRSRCRRARLVARALGQEVDEATAQAKYNDGVLELTLPKKTVAAAKRLEVH